MYCVGLGLYQVLWQQLILDIGSLSLNSSHCPVQIEKKGVVFIFKERMNHQHHHRENRTWSNYIQLKWLDQDDREKQILTSGVINNNETKTGEMWERTDREVRLLLLRLKLSYWITFKPWWPFAGLFHFQFLSNLTTLHFDQTSPERKTTVFKLCFRSK